jgi:hypothetical protein
MAARLYRMTAIPAVELAKVTMWPFLTKARLKKGRMVTLLAIAPPARCAASRSLMTWQWRYSAFATDCQNQTGDLAKVTMRHSATKERLAV